VSGAPHTDVEVEYFDHAVGVRVSLDGRADDGAPGEGDGRRARGCAPSTPPTRRDVVDARARGGLVDVYGNGGDDRLDASPDGGALYGATGTTSCAAGPVRDRLDRRQPATTSCPAAPAPTRSTAATGRNVVTGGPGRDRIDVQGNGHDVIRARDGGRDDVGCAVLPSSLEVDRADRLWMCAFPVAPRPTLASLLAHRRLRLLLACPRPAPGGCRGIVRLTDTSPRAARTGPLHDRVGSAHPPDRCACTNAPRGGQITALVYAHRARPPDSTRVTVTSLQLAPP
jgi:hypothetical protein